MQIEKELLAEDKYTGIRLIPIKTHTVYQMAKEVDKIQKQANPILDEMEKLSKEKLEPTQIKIRELKEEIKKLQDNPEYIQAIDEYEVLLKRVELKDNKATVIKNKMQPLVDAEIEGQLGEFEKPLKLIGKDGKYFVEVIDELEEWLKGKRKNNATS